MTAVVHAGQVRTGRRSLLRPPRPSQRRPLRRAPSGPTRSLEQAYDPRSNSLDLLRLLLAAAVAVAHGCQIAWGWQPTLGHTQVGALAVDGFFVLSGYLVTISFLRLGSPWRFAWHRFLRIMPAFWVCLLLTAFVVAPILSVLSGGGVADALGGEQPSYRYVLDNGALFMRTFDVGGLPAGDVSPGVVNGALWTLWFEACCYALVGAAGVAGLLRGRGRLAVVAVAVSCGIALAIQDARGAELPGDLYLRLVFLFALGALGHLYADLLPVRGSWALAALAVTGAALALAGDYRPWAGAAFAYLCLWAVVSTPWLRHRPRRDLSYGLYVYHWPVQVLLVTAGAAALGPAYLPLAVGVPLLAALASWTLVESPALARKGRPAPRFRRVRPARAAAARSWRRASGRRTSRRSRRSGCG